VLAVGDEAFAHRCLRRIEECSPPGHGGVRTTSPGRGDVERASGSTRPADPERSPRQVADAYREAIAERKGASTGSEGRCRGGAAGRSNDQPVSRRSSAGARAPPRSSRAAARLDGRETTALGPEARFVLDVRAAPLDDPCLDRVTTRAAWSAGAPTSRRPAPASLRGRAPSWCDVRAALGPGEYLVDLAIRRDGAPYDYRRRISRSR
jgi:hypothetical protein